MCLDLNLHSLKTHGKVLNEAIKQSEEEKGAFCVFLATKFSK